MLADWMLYCAAVGVLLSGGALALERGLRALGRPTRWVWAGAMALTLAVPAAARVVPAADATPAASAAAPAARKRPAPVPLAAETRARRLAPPTLDLGRWDPALRLAWGASSAAVLLALAAMAAVLGRRRRGWSAAEVDGVPVLVSPDVGPAVVGIFRSRIVLPAWTLSADEQARRLVLEHEGEHVRAGDPRLLAAAIVFAALTPWNPAAWWQLRRLRLAIEVDCDARVLRRRGDVRAYGSVLLEVGRRAVRSPLPVAAFAEPVSSLERRIRIMTAPRARRPLLRAAAFAALAAGLVAVACEAPQPTQPPSAGPSFARKTQVTPPGVLQLADVAVQPELVNRAEIQEQLKESYPPSLRNAGVEGIVTVSMVVGADGLTRAPEVVHTSHEAFREPAIAVAARMRFQPAKKDGRAVAVQVTLPVVFQLSRSKGGPAGADAEGRVDEVALRSAVRRHYPPLKRDAGITAVVTVAFTVGADGKAREVTLVDRGVDPAFAQAARAVVADLTFQPTAPREEIMMMIPFLPERRPAPDAR